MPRNLLSRLFVQQFGIPAFTSSDVQNLGVAEVVQRALKAVDPNNDKAIHVSFDIDGIDPIEAPSTGTPELTCTPWMLTPVGVSENDDATSRTRMSCVLPIRALLLRLTKAWLFRRSSENTSIRGGLSLREGICIMEEIHRTGRLVALDLVEFNPSLGSPEQADLTTAACLHVIRSALGYRQLGLFKSATDVPTFTRLEPVAMRSQQ